MLILLSGSHCKICRFPKITNSTNTRDCHCWQWAKFTMGPNEQNQHFAELRQKVCLYIHTLVLLRGLPSLEGKNELFVRKTRKKRSAQSSQTDYRSPLPLYHRRPLLDNPRTISLLPVYDSSCSGCCEEMFMIRHKHKY